MYVYIYIYIYMYICKYVHQMGLSTPSTIPRSVHQTAPRISSAPRQRPSSQAPASSRQALKALWLPKGGNQTDLGEWITYIIYTYM